MTTSSVFPDGGPMSEDEYFALGESSSRVELFDGGLFITPAGAPLHQHACGRLGSVLDRSAREAGVLVHKAVNVRLKRPAARPGRGPTAPDPRPSGTRCRAASAGGRATRAGTTPAGPVLHRFTRPAAAALTTRFPTCATRDIATVAVRLLRDRSWTGSGEVPVLGPEDLSFDEMAQIMSEVLHRPVHYRQTPDAGYKATLVAHGMSESVAQGMLDMMRAKNEGLDNAAIRTPENSTPTTFRQWCTETLLQVVHS